MSGPKLHADEVPTDVKLVGRLVGTQFPQWADLPVRPVLSAGTVNTLYRIGEGMVARLPRLEQWATDLDREHKWLLHLAPLLPVPIPVPLAKGQPGEGYPWQWSIYGWLNGENPAIAGKDGKLAIDLAEFITALREIDTSDGPPSGRGVHLLERDKPTRAAIDALRDVVDTEAVTAAWEESINAPMWAGPPAWIHGDLLPGNLLVEGDRLSAVIDFGGVGIGDPACDMIAAWSVLSAESRESFREAVAADDATWIRGRGWALSIALIILPYYQDTNPEFIALATHMVEQVLADRHGSLTSQFSG